MTVPDTDVTIAALKATADAAYKAAYKAAYDKHKAQLVAYYSAAKKPRFPKVDLHTDIYDGAHASAACDPTFAAAYKALIAARRGINDE